MYIANSFHANPCSKMWQLFYTRRVSQNLFFIVIAKAWQFHVMHLVLFFVGWMEPTSCSFENTIKKVPLLS